MKDGLNPYIDTNYIYIEKKKIKSRCSNKRKKKSDKKQCDFINNNFSNDENKNLDYTDIETIYNKSYTDKIPFWGPVVNKDRAWVGFGLGEGVSISISDDYSIGNWISLTASFKFIDFFGPGPDVTTIPYNNRPNISREDLIRLNSI